MLPQFFLEIINDLPQFQTEYKSVMIKYGYNKRNKIYHFIVNQLLKIKNQHFTNEE